MSTRIGRAAQRVLRLRRVRHAYGLLRYWVYRYLLRNLRVLGRKDDSHLGRQTFDHNFPAIRRSILKHDRVQAMIWPLLAIDEVVRNKPSLKTLSIGPRSEGELLLIAAHGFSWGNIRGVDLFSYCPRIDVADMHDLPYPDGTFDVVFSGWSLAYSDDRPRALREMVRILRHGGYVSFGQGYSSVPPGETDDWVGASERPNTLDEIFAPIADSIGTHYFRHEITPEMAAQGQRSILAVFSVSKQ